MSVTKVSLHFYMLKYLLLILSVTQQVLLMEQELLTLPEHLSSPPVFSGVRVTQSLV